MSAPQTVLPLGQYGPGSAVTGLLPVPVDVTGFQIDVDVHLMTDPGTRLFAFIDLSQDGGLTFQPGPPGFNGHSLFIEHVGNPNPPTLPPAKGGGFEPVTFRTDLPGQGNPNRVVRAGLEVQGGTVTLAMTLTTLP